MAPLGPPSPVIERAHDLGLLVHAWTFRRENRFLPPELRYGSQPDAPGDMLGEVAAFLAAGIDGFFTDSPDLGAMVTELYGSGGATSARRAPRRRVAAGSP